MHSPIETERLRLRKFTTDDADFIVALLNSPGWLQYIGDRNVHTSEQAVKYLEQGPILSYSMYGYGMWVAERKQDGKAIGACGIIKRDFLEHPDIGYAFLPEFNGMGYAYEAANATMAYATEKLNLPVICAITVPENKRSIRLLQKIGLSYKTMVTYPGTDEQLQLYST